MSNHADIHLHALQRFEPDPDVAYTIDTAAHLAGMPRHLVLVCCKHGMIAPRVDPTYGGYWFDATAIRILQRIAYLHVECGVNLTGIQIILRLMNEIEHMRQAEMSMSQV